MTHWTRGKHTRMVVMPSNYPDGMSEGDLPGYWDTECPYCDETNPDSGCDLCEGSGICDSREYNKMLDDEAAISRYEDSLDRDDDYRLYGRDL